MLSTMKRTWSSLLRTSAKLLSREVATSMRGRGWEIPVYPFSFREFLRHQDAPIPEEPERLSAKKAATLDHHFARYLVEGGFPEAQGLSISERRRLLQGYVDVALLRDVIERHEIRNPTALRWLTRRLLSAPAGLFSVTKFAADLKSQGVAASRDSLYEFLDHLEDAYLVHMVSVATESEKRRQVKPRKVYPMDPALIPLFDRSGKSNLGHALEVCVFIELQRRGAEVTYVHTPQGFEVDFLARYPDGTEELIQVCADLSAPETFAREMRALQDAGPLFPNAGPRALTAESRLPMPETPKGVTIRPAWEWMLAP